MTMTTSNIDESISEKIIIKAAEKAGLVAVIVMTAMVFLTTADVFLRFFFDKPIAEVYEFTGFMMLITSSLSIAWCAAEDQHVKVDLVVRFFKVRIQNILDSLNYLVVMGLSAVMIVETFKFGLFMKARGATPTLVKIPYYPFYFIMVLGYILLFLVVLTMLIKSVRKVVGK